MEQYRVVFDELDWQTGIQGARFKVFVRNGTQLRLLELSSEFVEADWCEKGHMGLVINGELEIDFRGRRVRYPQGSALFIPPGAANGHKARSVAAVTQLFLVEET